MINVIQSKKKNLTFFKMNILFVKNLDSKLIKNDEFKSIL